MWANFLALAFMDLQKHQGLARDCQLHSVEYKAEGGQAGFFTTTVVTRHVYLHSILLKWSPELALVIGQGTQQP